MAAGDVGKWHKGWSSSGDQGATGLVRGSIHAQEEPGDYRQQLPAHIFLPADTNECTEFPFVCPRDKPVCVNTYGGYRCRSNKRCSRGFEPNEDGTACVGE